MPISRMNKLLYTYTRQYYIQQYEWTNYNMQHNTDELYRHSVESKKPNNILFHLFEVQEQAKQIYEVRITDILGIVV